MTTNPNAIQDTIQQRYPTLTAAFNPPARPSDIAEAERKLGVEFPENFKEFYLVSNGQQLDELGCAVGIPCIPRMPLGGGSMETCTWGEFLSLDGIVQATLAHRELHEFDDPDDEELELVGPVNVHRHHIIFCDPGSGDCIGLDLSPAAAGQLYQVVAINHDPFGFGCLAPSFVEFLARVVNSISSSECIFSEDDGCFVPAAEM